MKGFTLIEILIAISIFIMIALIIGSVITFSGRIYQKSENIMEITQNGRVFFDAVSREIRQAERIVNSLPERKEDGVSEIIFRDGHLEEIEEEGVIQGGEGRFLTLPDESSDKDDFYKDSYIKITSESSEVNGKIRKVVSYQGDQKRIEIESPFKEDGDYFGLEYMIDTTYYIHYFLEDNYIKRAVYAYYFSDDPQNYVPIDAVPGPGNTLNQEVIESRIIGEYFQDLRFWEDNGINVYINLFLKDNEIELFKKISGRNL